MEVIFDYDNQEFYIKEKINNQTFYMAFQEEIKEDTIYYNVYMTLYTKRKHINKNESAVLITGNNPIRTVIIAKKAFNELEKEVVENCSDLGFKTCIYLTWLDNRRKKAYYKILSKKGYRYANCPDDNRKMCIMKIFESEDDIV